MEKGLIQVYTSESEQVNFAPMGLSLRAAGQELRTLITSFMPYDFMEGAPIASSLLAPYLTVDQTAIAPSSSHSNGISGVRPKIGEVFEQSREAVFSGAFDIVILNGILDLLGRQLLPLKEILHLLEEKPEGVELVLSGPRAGQQIIDRADYVTEMVVHRSNQPQQTGTCPVGNGLIEVVTGNGKGKTTYCLGKGLLTASVGIPALIFQFIKSPRAYGEVKAIERIPLLEIKTMGKGFLIKHSPYLIEKHKKAAREAWELWLRLIYSQDYGLLVMDEINIATSHGLISGERVREMFFLKPHKFDILLSGRNAHPEVMKGASTVIEMKEIKHPFAKGVQARKGIEY